MINDSHENTVRRGGRFGSWLATLAMAVAVLAVVTGCQTEPSPFAAPGPAVTNSLQPVIPESVTPPGTTNASAFTLREGDILKITFPGSPNLNNVQQIRTDGKITMPLIGEVQAAGPASFCWVFSVGTFPAWYRAGGRVREYCVSRQRLKTS